MNFLLHHEFALTELAEGEAARFGAVGAMLPDLWRMADRRVRPKALGPDERFRGSPDRALSAILDGIDHHLQIDRWFHRSRSFVEGEKDLRARFFETKSPKLLLFAHAAWEMCLDGALVRERGLASITKVMDAALTSAQPHLEKAANVHHFDGGLRESHERARFDERMGRILAASKDGGLFDDYVSAKGIARRLAGMRLAFGFAPPANAELNAWSAALDERVEKANGALVQLREERAESNASEGLRESQPAH